MVLRFAQKRQSAVSQIRPCAWALGLTVHELEQPFRWGEGLGLSTRRFPEAMFSIGAGENSPALHSDDYAFNDRFIVPQTIGMRDGLNFFQ